MSAKEWLKENHPTIDVLLEMGLKLKNEALCSFMEQYAESQAPTHDQFNTIADLRPYLLLHPDSEMVETSCLHFLGDAAQEWYYNQKK